MPIVPTLLAALLFGLSPVSLRGGAVIDAPAFRLAFPQGWQVLPGSDPIRVSGPRHTLVTICSTEVTYAPHDVDSNQKRGDALLALIRSIDSDNIASNVHVKMPWRVSSLPNGALLREILATSKDRSTFTAHIVLPGRTALIHLRLEGPQQAATEYDAARAVLLNVKWK